MIFCSRLKTSSFVRIDGPRKLAVKKSFAIFGVPFSDLRKFCSFSLHFLGQFSPVFVDNFPSFPRSRGVLSRSNLSSRISRLLRFPGLARKKNHARKNAGGRKYQKKHGKSRKKGCEPFHEQNGRSDGVRKKDQWERNFISLGKCVYPPKIRFLISNSSLAMNGRDDTFYWGNISTQEGHIQQIRILTFRR